MDIVTPEHLAAIMLQAKRETALHIRNVGIYGNSCCSDEEMGTTERWVRVRDYLKRETVENWTYDSRRPSQYRNVMAAAERCVEVYNERILATRVLDILTEHMTKSAQRRTLH